MQILKKNLMQQTFIGSIFCSDIQNQFPLSIIMDALLLIINQSNIKKSLCCFAEIKNPEQNCPGSSLITESYWLSMTGMININISSSLFSLSIGTIIPARFGADISNCTLSVSILVSIS